jgi:predicted nucleic-acid-binding Zn-ribbon protein
MNTTRTDTATCHKCGHVRPYDLNDRKRKKCPQCGCRSYIVRVIAPEGATVESRGWTGKVKNRRM